METLNINTVYCGDSVSLMERIVPNSIALSFWSPPYLLGKDYEKDVSYDSWQDLLENIIGLHYNGNESGESKMRCNKKYDFKSAIRFSRLQQKTNCFCT